MAKIFISYSHKDDAAIRTLGPQIENVFGYGSHWYDRGIQGGADWLQTILEEIEKCQIFLYLVSDESVNSPHCLDELRQAFRHDKSILPILLPTFSKSYNSSFPTDLQDKMDKLQYEDIRAGYGDLSRIWGALNRLFSTLRLPLSITDRWILFNQFHIMSKLAVIMGKFDDNYQDDYDPASYEHSKEILTSGYEWYYSDISQHIDTNVFPYAASLEVVDILNMFWNIQLSFDNLTDTTGINHACVEFQGFGGNNETSAMQFARFMIDEMDDFQSLKRNDYNSHGPMLPIYRAMLDEWKRSKNKSNLTKEDLIRITNA